MRILVAGILVTGIGAGIFANPVVAEQPGYDKTIEKRVIERLQAKFDVEKMRGTIEPDDQPVFVTNADMESEHSSTIRYQPPQPDFATNSEDGLKPIVYVNPFKVDTIITTSTAENGGKAKRIRLIWEKFDSEGNPILDN